MFHGEGDISYEITLFIMGFKYHFLHLQYGVVHCYYCILTIVTMVTIRVFEAAANIFYIVD